MAKTETDPTPAEPSDLKRLLEALETAAAAGDAEAAHMLQLLRRSMH